MTQAGQYPVLQAAFLLAYHSTVAPFGCFVGHEPNVDRGLALALDELEIELVGNGTVGARGEEDREKRDEASGAHTPRTRGAARVILGTGSCPRTPTPVPRRTSSPSSRPAS